jgi:hypothetical protein
MKLLGEKLNQTKLGDTLGVYNGKIPTGTLHKYRDFGSKLSPARGEDLYRALTRELGSSDAATQLLQSHGLPGIKYLDGSSRAGGEGSRNFVMFNPDDIRILERNGQATGAKPWAETNALAKIVNQGDD